MYDVFKVVSDIMAQLYAMINGKKINCELMFITSNDYGRIVFILKLISDIMAQCYLMVYAFVITINFYNVNIMNCALTLIISNHNGRIFLIIRIM